MGARAGAARARGGLALTPQQIATLFGAANAWDAEHVTAAATTTAWTATAGAVNLAVQTTAQPAPAAVASLNGKLAVTWNAAGAYVADVAALGDSQTFMFCGRISGANFGMMALTAAGTLNTGSALFFDPTAGGTVFGRRLAADVTALLAGPVSVVIIATKTLAGESLYINSTSPVTTAAASLTFSQTRFILGALNSANLYASSGNVIASSALWGRVLSATEINRAMRGAGAYYGVTIT